MSVKSMFDFKFPEAKQEEGLAISLGIGHDMTVLDGYVDHEVIQDVKDPGHLMVNTLWASQAQSDAVLSKYQSDPKIQQATALIGGSPSGFVGTLLPKSA